MINLHIFKNKTVQSYLILFIGLTLIEIVFRFVSSYEIFNFSLFRVLISNLIIAIILGYLTSLFSKKTSYILNMLLLFFFSFYAFVQAAFLSHMGVYMSLNASSQLGAVTSYISEFIESIKPSTYLIFLPFIVILSIVIFSYYMHKYFGKKEIFKLKRTMNYQNTIMLLSSLIIITLCSYAYAFFLDEKYMMDKYQAVSPKDLFLSASNPGLCVKEFGVLSFGAIDVKSKFMPVEDTNIYFAYVDSQKEVDPERSFDDSAWISLNEKETNSVYKNLNNYFINNSITSRNEKTGLFAGKNLIVIMMESVNDIIYNKEYFPNFYKLATEGMYFPNNYSPRNTCPTGNNEMSSIIGLYSTTNECTANVYSKNTYFASLFNLFNNENYYTSSYHNYGEYYYLRSIYHPNMGSQLYQDAEDMNIMWDHDYGNWADDGDLIDYYLKDIDAKVDYTSGKKFMSFLTTVSSHRPYNSTELGDRYLSMTENTNYSMELRRYLSKLKILDNALGSLISGLEERGLLEDTVIVLWGDHQPYGLSEDNFKEILDRPLDDLDTEKVPLVIYNKGQEKEVNDSYTSYINLTPTLANLFDLNFDPRYYVGTDIFSEDYLSLVVFPDLSWKNEYAYYNATTGELKYYTDFIYEEEKIREINNAIYAKYNASVLAIKYDYFTYLGKNLDKLKEGIIN